MSAVSRTPKHTESFQLAPDEVHSWCVSLDVSPEARNRLHSILDRDEHSRAERFRFERDRKRFVVVHGVLRELLARYLRVRPSRVRYVCNAFGKPDLSPEFGARLKFNLSHSTDLALIALAADSNVGVDLEQIRAQPDYLEIARRFFSVAEVDYLERLPKYLRAEAFFSCWTRTEAYVKACGEGLANIEGASNAVSPARHWSLYTIRPAPGYVGTLAIEGIGWRLTQLHWQMSTYPGEVLSFRTWSEPSDPQFDKT